jgi:hypothetical protein
LKNGMFMLAVSLLFACSVRMALAQSATTAPASSSSAHAVAGDLEKVSADGKEITVKTADGTEKVFKVTGKTTVDGAKDVALATKEGSHIVVHYTVKGAEETATGVEDAGKGTWKVTEGTVTKIGEGGKDVTIKLGDGTEKTYHVGKEATVDAGHGIVDAGKYTGNAGDKVAVYTVEDPTKEVVRLFKKL